MKSERELSMHANTRSLYNCLKKHYFNSDSETSYQDKKKQLISDINSILLALENDRRGIVDAGAVVAATNLLMKAMKLEEFTVDTRFDVRHDF